MEELRGKIVRVVVHYETGLSDEWNGERAHLLAENTGLSFLEKLPKDRDKVLLALSNADVPAK